MDELFGGGAKYLYILILVLIVSVYGCDNN